MSKLLFICSGNRLRSPTAEKVFGRSDFKTRSVGTSRNAVQRVSLEHLKWADHIFVMEEKHKQRLLAEFPSFFKFKDITVLDITDKYQYMDEKLVFLLKRKLAFFGLMC